MIVNPEIVEKDDRIKDDDVDEIEVYNEDNEDKDEKENK